MRAIELDTLHIRTHTHLAFASLSNALVHQQFSDNSRIEA